MKLYVRLYPLDERSATIVTHRASMAEAGMVSGRYPIALDDPALPVVLNEGESSRGFWVSGEAVFSPAELRTLTHFEVVCRKLVTETRKDFEWNDAAKDKAPLLDAGGESPIRLLGDLALTHVRLKPNMVGGIGDWTQEYVIGAGVAGAFQKAKLSGLSLLSVRNPKTGATHEGFSQIFSDSILKPAVIDCSVERIQSSFPSEDGQQRHLGCLSYTAANLEDTMDFSRTAEPWGGWHGWPLWVVRAKVKELFTKEKLRGWAFRPVLLTNTDLYADYVRQWERLCRLVGQCTKSKFDGGRW